MRVMACSKSRAAGQDVAKSAVRAHAQSFVNAGAAQVGVDQQHAHAFLRQHDRGIDAGGGLAFLRQGAGHHDDFGRRSKVGQQQRGAQGAVRFRHLRLRAGLG